MSRLVAFVGLTGGLLLVFGGALLAVVVAVGMAPQSAWLPAFAIGGILAVATAAQAWRLASAASHS